MTIKAIEAHPFAEIFPLHNDGSLVEMRDNMRARVRDGKPGQIEDIVLFEGKVLDGRRRQLAAIGAGLTPRYRQWGSDKGDGGNALDWVRDKHIRRNLSDADRHLAAAAYANLRKGYFPNPASAGLGKKPVTQKEAAKAFKVSEGGLERAKRVLEKGVPELIKAYREEKVTVKDAASIAGQTPEVQRAALADVEAGKAATLAEAVKTNEAAKPAPSKPPKPADKEKVADAIEKAADDLARVVTGKVELRDMMVKGLRQMVANVRTRL
jgi:hypothetical protein